MNLVNLWKSISSPARPDIWALATCYQLLKEGKAVRVFLLPNEPFPLKDQVEVVYGDVTDPASLLPFFDNPNHDDFFLIHAAGVVSIASRYDANVHAVNVEGTANVMAEAFRTHVKKIVYVSSVHAIKEKPKGHRISETSDFDPKWVKGLYAKTKAEAVAHVLSLAKEGLPVVVVHPSGILGPYDLGRNHLVALLKDFSEGKLTAAVKGGYDFVDVRDVVDGILKALRLGKNGECYILSGEYHSIKELLDLAAKDLNKAPIKTYLAGGFVRFFAPLEELWYRMRKAPPLFTSYSLYTLRSNSLFSHAKASQELDYTVRPFEATIKDTLSYLLSEGKSPESYLSL
jgi:dihydroflavonol-4-reductase